MRQLSRDPFSRTTLMRQTVTGIERLMACDWCGQSKRTKAGLFILYRYITEHDDGRRESSSRLFCSKSCHHSFHN